jgi:type IV secretion system protein TrbL
MQGTGVIDTFLNTFTTYIDSGFGLLKPEVAFVATTLIVIDVTLAALFWSWGADDDIIARLVKKTLFVGVFAYLIGNWNNLAQIVFQSFSGLGLKAAGSSLSATDFLHPGKIAQVGLDAGRPLLTSISGLMGYISFFENFIQIVVLLFAWVMVLLAFFVLAIQLFVTLIEFKLSTLAGFVLIPFGLFGKSAFMAERVLGNVISSGIKVLVLAVIVGIGSTLFSQFTAASGAQPSIDDAMAIVLAALSLLGLGIFGPGIANGLVSGGPQLSAGAAVGTGLAAGGVVAAGAAAAGAAVSGGATLAGGAAAAARAGATMAGGASAAYSLGAAGQTGAAGVASGLGGVARAGANAAISPLRRAVTGAADSMRSNFASAARSVAEGAGGASAEGAAGATATDSPATGAPADGGTPAWAKRMKRSQQMSHGAQTAAHAVRSGDGHGGGSSINLSEGDR